MKRLRLEMAVGLFVLFGLICVGYLTIRLGKMELLGENTYPLKASFRTVSGLKEGAEVELAGVSVGKVDAIRLNKKTYKAMITLEIDNGVELSDDTIASVKTSGLIGDKYIQLSPGGSPDILKPGDTIIETESPIDIEEIVSKYAFGSVEKE